MWRVEFYGQHYSSSGTFDFYSKPQGSVTYRLQNVDAMVDLIQVNFPPGCFFTVCFRHSEGKFQIGSRGVSENDQDRDAYIRQLLKVVLSTN